MVFIVGVSNSPLMSKWPVVIFSAWFDNYCTAHCNLEIWNETVSWLHPLGKSCMWDFFWNSISSLAIRTSQAVGMFRELPYWVALKNWKSGWWSHHNKSINNFKQRQRLQSGSQWKTIWMFFDALYWWMILAGHHDHDDKGVNLV